MVNSTLFWDLYTLENRNKAVEDIKSAIQNSGGFIVRFTMYSDLVLNLTVEIDANWLTHLLNGLSTLVDVSHLNVNALEHNSGVEYINNMHISFGKGKGKLRHEIPNVPG